MKATKVGQAQIIGKKEDGTLEWHSQRQNGIGGSEAGIVLGLQPFGDNRFKLWERKLGRRDRFTGNAATEYGSKIEDYLFRQLQLDYGVEAVECEYTLRHPDYSWMRANIDGLVPGEGIVEIKSSSSGFDGEVEDYHYAQIQHYLAVTGLEYCVYVGFEIPFDRTEALWIERNFVDDPDSYWSGLVERGNVTTKRVTADESFQERLMDIEADFWVCVEEEKTPEELPSEDTEEIEPDDDPILYSLINEYAEAKERIKNKKQQINIDEIKDKKEQLKERIKSHCGCYETKRIELETGDHLTWDGRGYWRIYEEDRELDDEDTLDVGF